MKEVVGAPLLLAGRCESRGKLFLRQERGIFRPPELLASSGLPVLKQFNVRELPPGPYTFEVTVEDHATDGVVSQIAESFVE